MNIDQPNTITDLKAALVKEIANRVTKATGFSTDLPSLKRAKAADLTILMQALGKREATQ